MHVDPDLLTGVLAVAVIHSALSVGVTSTWIYLACAASSCWGI